MTAGSLTKAARNRAEGMNMLANLNEAMAYIEQRLDEEIDLKSAARIAACSEHHFKRMFSSLAGITLPEYIRRRRLAKAAFLLQSGEEEIRILDLALRCGYESADSFARAFRRMHGIAPSEARGGGNSLKAYPPITFRLRVEGGRTMNYRIEERPAFRIVGIMRRVPIVFEGVNPDIAAMWQSLTPEKIDALNRLSCLKPDGLVNASTNFSEERMEEKGDLDHYIGVATTEKPPQGYASLEIEASSWAVFEVVGPLPGAAQEIWGRIYSEWFPSSAYQKAEGPEIFWTEQRDQSAPDYRSEIWIPVCKREV